MKLDDGMNYDWTPLQQVLCTMLSKIAKNVIEGNFAIHCASANTQSESVEMNKTKFNWPPLSNCACY